jgi:hypothetical protein
MTGGSAPGHADEHSPEWILLAVDKKLEGAGLGFPELADPIAPVEVGSIRTWGNSARGAGRLVVRLA